MEFLLPSNRSLLGEPQHDHSDTGQKRNTTDHHHTKMKTKATPIWGEGGFRSFVLKLFVCSLHSVILQSSQWFSSHTSVELCVAVNPGSLEIEKYCTADH